MTTQLIPSCLEQQTGMRNGRLSNEHVHETSRVLIAGNVGDDE